MYNEAINILKRLEKYGYKAYIVGGYPRDKYLNKESCDIDICTNAKPEELKEIFENIDLTYEKYGNVIVKINNYKFEITTFRNDFNYIYNRKPSIKFVKTLKEDLLRRDFIINTLCIDRAGNYVDLLHARNDIDNKVIRFVKDKEEFNEDALRILRAIRFATILNFKLDINVKKGIKEYGYLVSNLSKQRIKDELDIIFESDNKEYGISLLLEFNLDKYLHLVKLKDVNLKDNIWRQLDVFDIYPFSKKQLKEIKISIHKK